VGFLGAEGPEGDEHHAGRGPKGQALICSGDAENSRFIENLK